MSLWKTLLASALLTMTWSSAMAQQLYIYPARGQSPRLQDRDKYECSNWATQQTGFNPMQGPPQLQVSAPPPPGMFGTAMGGAALGAIGGAIGGDAGKGAAIGAGLGGLFGAMRRHRYYDQQQYLAQQQAVAYGNEKGAYVQAYRACLVGRGYSVS